MFNFGITKVRRQKEGWRLWFNYEAHGFLFYLPASRLPSNQRYWQLSTKR